METEEAILLKRINRRFLVSQCLQFIENKGNVNEIHILVQEIRKYPKFQKVW
jgi:hypothetical protein